MFSGEPNFSHFSKQSVIVWLSLAFQAGAINTGGYLACHRFVTHTTGFATLFGEETAKGSFLTGLGMLSVPVFFLVGSMLSAFYIERSILNNERPRYSSVFLIMSSFLAIVVLMGSAGIFGEFGRPADLASDYTLLALLSLTSGMQNATVTSAFGAVVRTTHLTGITTDLGIGIMRMFYKNVKNHNKETKANWMRMGIILCFILGSLISSIIFFKVAYFGFAIPFAISVLLLIFSIKTDKSPHHKITKQKAS